MASETTPLVSSKNVPGDMHRKASSSGEDSFATAFSRDRTAVDEFNPRPVSSVADEFNPRPVSYVEGHVSGRNARPSRAKTHQMKTPSVGGGFLLDFVPDAWNP